MMQSLFGGGELGLLGGGSGDSGGLKEDGCGSVAWNSSTLPPDDVYSTSNFALITAYQDIKTRLGCLERENTTIKRRLKMYEIKVWMAAALLLLPDRKRRMFVCSTCCEIRTEIKGEEASLVFDPGRIKKRLESSRGRGSIHSGWGETSRNRLKQPCVWN